MTRSKNFSEIGFYQKKRVLDTSRNKVERTFVSTYLLGCLQEIEHHTPEVHAHNEVLEVFEAPRIFSELLHFFEVGSSLIPKSTNSPVFSPLCSSS
jgi:hypothetical protein